MTKSEDKWILARQVYDDLAIPEFHTSFTDWFTSRIEHEFRQDVDWKVEIKNDNPVFWITRAVADQIARDEIGLSVTRNKFLSHKRNENRFQLENPQKYAITGDEDLLK